MARYYSKLRGEKVYLSPMNPDDIETYTKWVNNPAISDNIGVTWNLFSREKEIETLDGMVKNGYNFAIIRIEDDALIGNLDLFDIHQVSRNAQCGIMLGDVENHAKGYGTEALRLLIGFAFHTLNLNNVMLKVYSFNEMAKRCYEKVGFKEIGRRRKSYFIRGAYHDEIFMDILAEEFSTHPMNDLNKGRITP